MKKIGVLDSMSVASTKMHHDLLCQYTFEELGGLVLDIEKLNEKISL